MKTKLFGWIANHSPSNPKLNLTILVVQGKQWLTEKIKVFISKADKGGVVLVMNYHDVQTAITRGLNNVEKFTKLERSAKEPLIHVRYEVRSMEIYLEHRKIISGPGKTRITGLRENSHAKVAPEYQPESLYAYSLFKINELIEAEIQQKKYRHAG